MGLRRSLTSYVAVLAIVLDAGSTWHSAVLGDVTVPAAVAQSDGYKKVFASIRHGLCGSNEDGIRSSMGLGAVVLDRGATIYAITNAFGNVKCGLGDVAAVTADGHGGYRTVLLERAQWLDVFPDGEAAASAPNMPGLVVDAFRYDGSVYRATGTCTLDSVNDVTFAAGASSQTMTGFLEYYPDSGYRVFARAGQKLAIDVHPVDGAIPTVGITSRTCKVLVRPASRSWRGTVPYSGYFYVLVTRPATLKYPARSDYTITISIT